MIVFDGGNPNEYERYRSRRRLVLVRRKVAVGLWPLEPHFRLCEGFRMPARDGGGGELSGLRAGVRKPPKEEIAGGDT
jgi:hypothetical protein